MSTCADCGAQAHKRCIGCGQDKCSEHFAKETAYGRRFTGRAIGGFPETVDGSTEVASELCLTCAGRRESARRTLASSIDRAELVDAIEAFFGRRDDLVDRAWQRIVNSGEVKAPTHELVTVEETWKAKNIHDRSQKRWRELEREPLWFAPSAGWRTEGSAIPGYFPEELHVCDLFVQRSGQLWLEGGSAGFGALGRSPSTRQFAVAHGVRLECKRRLALDGWLMSYTATPLWDYKLEFSNAVVTVLR